MTIQIDDPGHVHGGGRRGAVRSTIALAAAAALVASATSADAGPPQKTGAWSTGFDDSLWTDGLARPEMPPPLAGWGEQCLVDCGPAFGTYLVRRAELLSSSGADVSVNTVPDSTGHRMGVSGAIVIERLAPESFSADPGLLTDWVVTGERILDSEGTHSWSLLAPDSSPDARWLPIQPYRFDDASFSMTFAAAPAGATPEAPAWAMMLIGFAGLGAAGHRRARKSRRSVRHFEGKSR